jgi:hypothetical protein
MNVKVVVVVVVVKVAVRVKVAVVPLLQWISISRTSLPSSQMASWYWALASSRHACEQ